MPQAFYLCAWMKNIPDVGLSWMGWQQIEAGYSPAYRMFCWLCRVSCYRALVKEKHQFLRWLNTIFGNIMVMIWPPINKTVFSTNALPNSKALIKKAVGQAAFWLHHHKRFISVRQLFSIDRCLMRDHICYLRRIPSLPLYLFIRWYTIKITKC